MIRGFRVWDVEAEEYLPNSNGTVDGILGISADGKNVIWLEDGEATFFEDGRSVIIERDTGLKDKNGKRICEGDIVEFGISGRPERGYVAYADEYASFEVYSKRGFIFGCLFGHAGTVIGNINENPELLGGKE